MAWQSVPNPFVTPPAGAPNPAAAAILGLIPGVGAMYNGQFFKGLIHVVIFAILISITTHYGIFGIFIGAWVLYQSFEAFHTAKARRDGQPLPDPLGLNEVGNWLNLGMKPTYPPPPGVSGAGPAGANPPGYAPGPPPPGGFQTPYGTPYQPPYQAPYPAPPYAPAAGFTGQVVDPAAPPIPPPPPQAMWRRKEPMGAFVLIGLGILFLIGRLDDIGGKVFEFTWPLLLIGLGVWLVIRRMGDTQGGPR
jgi:TM2 domain-containing membrane protein YozV